MNKRSFPHAIVDAVDGVYQTMIEQPNFRVQAVLTGIAAVLATVLRFSAVQWAVLALTCGLVLVAELFNTSLEHAIDLIGPGNHPLARAAKHAGAGAVLVAAATALAVGAFLYGGALSGK